MRIEKLVVHASDAASLLGVSAQTVYAMIHSGKLPAYKEGKAWKIQASALEAYVQSRLNK